MSTNELIFDESKQRSLYIDFIKGIAIILVIWGHLIQYTAVNDFDFFENKIFKFIYTFHMPLLMMISGYLFYFSAKKRSFIQIVKHRITNIGICIFLWNTVQYLLGIIIKKEEISFWEYIDKLTGLWFLWSILICSILIALAE